MESKIKNILFAALVCLAASLAGCKKNIDEDILHQGGEITDDQLTGNFLYVKGFLDNIYNTIGAGTVANDARFNLDSNGAMLAAACDEAVNSNLNSFVYTLVNGTWGPARTFDDGYANYYNGIRKANVFLETISKGEIRPLNSTLTVDSLRKRWRGEAFFLRGLFHFELMKRYGPIIIANRVFDRTEDLNLPKNTWEECVAQVVLDCDSAYANLPQWNTDYNGSADTKEIGRATKIAAMALKARLYLYSASPLYSTGTDVVKWQKAADAAKAIIDLNRAQLITGYANVFNYSTAAYNNEVIFATQANNINSIEIFNAPVSFDGGLGRTNPTQEMVDAFEMSNGKPITDPTSGYNENNPYVNRDPRLALTIFFNGSTFKTAKVLTHVGGKDAVDQSINATKTGYYMKKFLSENARWNQVSNASIRRPWVLFRYAEVLLNYAEALNEAQGPVSAVHNAVNQVRARVSMPALPTNLNQAEMRARIKNERRVELCFEEHRFYDIRRWKEGETYFNKPVTGIKITVDGAGNPVTYQRVKVQDRVFEPKQNFFPFPQEQIDLGSNLKQNEGW
ncbi:RagB/SusD family nutrient uptake outer membrane protein [Flavitalea sp.]|nr:RagB/SusD family nutrient uptake outer membrane protein [Flavitalea sp.]